MIYIYLACLIIGGILLGGSLLLGALHADADADHDMDAGLDHDLDADASVDADADADADHDGDAGVDATGLWLPFFSMRFWVFSLTFFGLTGTLLTVFQVGSIATGGVAAALGLFCGTAAAYIVHRLGRMDATGDVPASKEFVGAVGEVLVTVAPGKRGKVRVEIRNHTVDLVATTSDDDTLEAGKKVLVVEYEDDLASVTRAPLASADEG